MNDNVKQFETEALVDNLGQVTAFIDEQIEEFGCSMKTQMQIELAVEEIFVNIASYAYAPGTGKALIKVWTEGEPLSVSIMFVDSGVQYNPLARENPDVTLPAKDRGIGGLGIYLTKKTMDDVTYEYRDGMNMLTLKKVLQG